MGRLRFGRIRRHKRFRIGAASSTPAPAVAGNVIIWAEALQQLHAY
jgi:hypothetical protein